MVYVKWAVTHMGWIQVMVVLSHINKRVKTNLAIKLPFDALLTQFTDEKVNTFVKNFTVIYLDMAVKRMDVDAIAKHIPSLVRGISKRPDPQRVAAFHMMLPVSRYLRRCESPILKTFYYRRYENIRWSLASKRKPATVLLNLTKIQKTPRSCSASFWT